MVIYEPVKIGSVEVFHVYSSDHLRIRKTGSSESPVSEAVVVTAMSDKEPPTFEEVKDQYTEETIKKAGNVVETIFNGMITEDRAKEISKTLTDTLPDSMALSIPELYPDWNSTGAYKSGDRRRYQGVLYKCLQDHTAQTTWTPEAAVSLWAKVLVEKDSNGNQTSISDWQQPNSTNPYAKGDKVKFNGKIYESNIDGNVWSPSAYPAGWKEVTE